MELIILSKKGSIVFKGVAEEKELSELNKRYPRDKFIYKPSGKVVCSYCGKLENCIEVLEMNICTSCYKECMEARNKVDELRGDN